MFRVPGILDGPAAGGRPGCVPAVIFVCSPRIAAASFFKRCCGVICLPDNVMVTVTDETTMPDTLPELEVDHQPGEYAPPVRHRLKYVGAKIWIGIIPLIIVVIAAAAVWANSHSMGDKTAMLLAVLAHLAVVIGAGVYFWRQKHAVYTVNGLRVEFLDADYYLPPHILEAYITEHVTTPMSAHMPLPWEALRGNRIKFVSDTIDVPQGGRAWGATWPGETSLSLVYAPYALHPGVTAWELKLQLCHVLFPGQSEKDDIAWLKSHDIA